MGINFNITARSIEQVHRAARVASLTLGANGKLEIDVEDVANFLDIDEITVADCIVELHMLGYVELDEHEEMIVGVAEITEHSLAVYAAYPTA